MLSGFSESQGGNIPASQVYRGVLHVLLWMSYAFSLRLAMF